MCVAAADVPVTIRSGPMGSPPAMNLAESDSRWASEKFVTTRNGIPFACRPRTASIALGIGALVLFPSMAWLLRVFKGHAVFGSDEPDGE